MRRRPDRRKGQSDGRIDRSIRARDPTGSACQRSAFAFGAVFATFAPLPVGALAIDEVAVDAVSAPKVHR